MKKIYLILAALGFIAPNIFVAMVSLETGNFLLWLDPVATARGMFGNPVSGAFVTDLLAVVAVFFVWSYREAARHAIRGIWIIWALTLLFGMAGAFPLFLYLRERKTATPGPGKP